MPGNLMSVFTALFVGRTNYPAVARTITSSSAQIINAMRSSSNAVRKFQTYSAEAFATFTLPVLFGAGFMAALRNASSFENQLDRLQNTVRGLQKSNAELARSAFYVAQSTGVAAEKILEIAEAAGQAGLGDKLGEEGLFRFTEVVAMLSKVSDMNIDTAAKSLSELALQFNLNGDEVERFASGLQLVAKRSSGTAANVLRYAKALIPLRQRTNMPMGEILGLAGAAKAFGNTSEQLFSTALPMFFDKTIDKTGKVAELLRMPLTQAMDLRRNQPLEYLLKVLERLNELRGHGDEFSLALRRIGLMDARQNKVLVGAAAQVKLIRDLVRGGNAAMRGRDKTLREDFAVVMGNFFNQVKKFQALVANTFIAAMLPVLEIMTPMLTIMNHLIHGMSLFVQTPFGGLLSSLGAVLALMTTIASVQASLRMTEPFFSGAMRGHLFPVATSGRAAEKMQESVQAGILAKSLADAAAARSKKPIAAGSALRKNLSVLAERSIYSERRIALQVQRLASMGLDLGGTPGAKKVDSLIQQFMVGKTGMVGGAREQMQMGGLVTLSSLLQRQARYKDLQAKINKELKLAQGLMLTSAKKAKAADAALLAAQAHLATTEARMAKIAAGGGFWHLLNRSTRPLKNWVKASLTIANFWRMTQLTLLAIGGYEVFKNGGKNFASQMMMVLKAWRTIVGQDGPDRFLDFAIAEQISATGLMPLLTALVNISDQFDAFFAGLKEGFNAIFSFDFFGLYEMGDGLKSFLDSLIDVLVQFGVIELSVADGGNAFKKFGIVVGAVAGVVIRAVTLVIDAFFLFLSLLTKVTQLAATPYAAGILGGLTGSHGVFTDVMNSVPGFSNPAVRPLTPSPYTNRFSSTRASRVDEDYAAMIRTTREAMSRGETPKEGIMGSMTVRNGFQINMDGARIADGVQKIEIDRKVAAGIPRAQAEGFGSSAQTWKW